MSAKSRHSSPRSVAGVSQSSSSVSSSPVYSFRQLYMSNPATGQQVPLHREARVVTDFGQERNHLPRSGQRAFKGTQKGDASDLFFWSGRPSSWLGTPLGQGAVGTVTMTRYNDRLNDLRQAATFAIKERSPPEGTPVAVKLQRDRSVSGASDIRTRDEFALTCVRESSLHQLLDSAPCVALPGLAVQLCSSSFVPDFYWSGMAWDQGSSGRVYVTVMESVPGKSLQSFLEAGGAMTADLYLRIEMAFASLWVNGVVHSDAHKGNVMYDHTSKRVTIVDFGFGAAVERRRLTQIRKAVAAAVLGGVRSLGEVWQRPDKSRFGVGLQNVANRVQTTRRQLKPTDDLAKLWYNPEGHSLRQWYNMLSEADQARVPDMRRTMWGGGSGSRPVSSPTTAARLAAAAAVTRARLGKLVRR